MQNDLLQKACAGDKSARDTIVNENLGLVYSVIKRFLNRGYEYDDLFQIGSIGLIKAIDNFDINYDVKFSTYAVPLIIGEIKRFIRDDGPVKVSRSLKELNMKARYLSENIVKNEGREPGINELAQKLEVDPCDLIEAMDSSQPISSLDEPIAEKDGNSSCLGEKFVDNKNPSESDIVNKMLITQVLNSLPPRDKDIIHLRFYQHKTQVEIAKMLGISQVQISRIEKRVLKIMRSHVCGE